MGDYPVSYTLTDQAHNKTLSGTCGSWEDDTITTGLRNVAIEDLKLVVS